MKHGFTITAHESKQQSIMQWIEAGSEKGQDGTSGGKGNGVCYLGCESISVDRLY